MATSTRRPSLTTLRNQMAANAKATAAAQAILAVAEQHGEYAAFYIETARAQIVELDEDLEDIMSRALDAGYSPEDF